MNHVDPPRAYEPSGPANGKRPAPGHSLVAIPAPVALALVCLTLTAPMSQAQTPVGRVTGLARTRAVQEASFGQGYTASSWNGLPGPDAPAEIRRTSAEGPEMEPRTIRLPIEPADPPVAAIARPPLSPSRHPSAGPSDDALASALNGLLEEADRRRTFGSGPIRLEVEMADPFRDEPGGPDPPRRAWEDRGAARPAPGSLAIPPPIRSLNVDVRPTRGEMPLDDAQSEYPLMAAVPAGPGPGRGWNRRVCLWEASSFCHRPLYFEEINLERYGFFGCDHRCGGVPAALVQPVLSGAHFFATVPALPYKMALDPPCECIYTLGHYRPGSCAPHQIHRIPLRPLPAAAEACAITGLVWALP